MNTPEKISSSSSEDPSEEEEEEKEEEFLSSKGIVGPTINAISANEKSKKETGKKVRWSSRKSNKEIKLAQT